MIKKILREIIKRRETKNESLNFPDNTVERRVPLLMTIITAWENALAGRCQDLMTTLNNLPGKQNLVNIIEVKFGPSISYSNNVRHVHCVVNLPRHPLNRVLFILRPHGEGKNC